MERLKQTAVRSSLQQGAFASYSLLCICCAFLLISLATPVWAAVPNAPSGLAATALSSTQIKLTWTDNSADESFFRIEYKKTTDLNFSYLTNVSANTTTYTHTNLFQNTDYIYRVQAYNASGYSAYSNETTATTLTLNAPTNLSVSSTSYTKVTLTWTDNSTDESEFYIEKIGSDGTWGRILTLGANTTTYTITGLTQGTVYYFRVQAYSGSYNYSEYTNEVSTTTPVLAAPSDLTATALSSTQIKLTWTDNSTDETYFYVDYKKVTDTTFLTLPALPANTTTYTHTGLLQNTTYVYRIRAYHSATTAYSLYSNEANATTLTLNAPTGLSASASYTKVTLTWTDNSTDESGFYIEKIGSNGTWGRILTLGANTTTYTITGLTQGTVYYFRVQAYSGSYNYSGYANEVSATTPVLAAPSDLTATVLSSSQIKLTWADNSSDETYFYIDYKTVTDTGFSTLPALPANTTTYTHIGLFNNTGYIYRIRAYHSGNGAYSANSNEASATTGTLNAPSNLTAAPLSSTQIKLTWKDNSQDETNFYVESKSDESDQYYNLASLSANTVKYTRTGLAAGTTYFYRVRAYNAGGYSSYSNEVSVTMPTCVQEGTYQP